MAESPGSALPYSVVDSTHLIHLCECQFPHVKWDNNFYSTKDKISDVVPAMSF